MTGIQRISVPNGVAFRSTHSMRVRVRRSPWVIDLPSVTCVRHGNHGFVQFVRGREVTGLLVNVKGQL
ncbi:hypothetical protein CEXT_563311 [Caerostris extrusa]|uniref:Uncharacterized protein n=1 Tax=Caerostris extrusa TaxID=172846 RepID=A0AAV4UJY5_CAEEX|nr:hypothetical protein CEXT_563311 [Caerostris extrusa]